jgi:hypothetical protein
MSKIALTPNATGTGVFTISSPATNTNRTLTLPDEAGTVLTSASSLASANLTGTVTVSGANVGIGTVTPSDTLHVKNAGGSTYLKIENGVSAERVYLGSEAGKNSIYSQNSGAGHLPLAIFTGNTERMRIDSSGNLLVGTTTVGLQNNMSCGFVGLNTTSYAVINHTSGTGGGNYYAAFGYNGSAIGSITQNGTTGVSYNTSSDYRLKIDAQPMTGASARVQALKPVNFEWISDGTRVDGFLAHEAQEVVPEAVHGTKDAMRDEEYEVTAAVYEDIIIAAVLDEEGNELEAERTEQNLVTEAVMGTRSVPDMQGIDQSKLVPLLTAALQEALNKIEAMETRLAALEAV